MKLTFKEIKKLAENGDKDSQFNLGKMYDTCEGLPEYIKDDYIIKDEEDEEYEDYNEDGHYVDAAKWYRRAADQGHMDAQFDLGLMYVNGEGVNFSNITSIKWMKKAAKQGHEEAMKFLELSS